jgi:DNA invertase Pin-like site-specific DNA recombinase
MRALSYLRVSSRHQIDGDGFARQRQAITEYLTTHNAEHLGEFVEEGISGTADLINRPALTRLTTYILEHGNIDTVIVEKSDRLSRDLINGELLIRQFSEMGIRVIEAEGGNDLTAGTDNPTATLIRQVLAAVAQFEKSSVVSKLRQARNRKRAERGKCEGRKAVGEMAGEQVVVDRIWRLREEGLTTRQIAGALDAEGITTRGGGKWSHSVVARVVSRERRARADREITNYEP